MRNPLKKFALILLLAWVSTHPLAQEAAPSAADTGPSSIESLRDPSSTTATGTMAETPQGNKGVAKESGLDAEIRALRQDILELNSELSLAEKEFLFPASTQFTVFVSMDTSKQFDLRSVELRLNNKVVAHHLFTEREVYALQRGGMHRMFIGSIAPGSHELVAYFMGTDTTKRDYRRGISHKFEKTEKPLFSELKITNIRSRKLPEFEVGFWE